MLLYLSLSDRYCPLGTTNWSPGPCRQWRKHWRIRWQGPARRCSWLLFRLCRPLSLSMSPFTSFIWPSPCFSCYPIRPLIALSRLFRDLPHIAFNYYFFLDSFSLFHGWKFLCAISKTCIQYSLDCILVD